MTINVELRDEQAVRLDRFATGLHKSRGEATAQLIEEGLRHAEFPAIEFRDSAAGRQAYVVGSGLAVWEVLMVAEGYGLEFGATVQHLRIDRDHVIALNEQHLRRLVRDYVSYHHHDRIHDALDKDTPNRRLVERKPSAEAVVISNARLGRTLSSLRLARSRLAAVPGDCFSPAGSDRDRNRCVYPLFFLCALCLVQTRRSSHADV